ncbi:MAG: hypothetical protein Q9219_003214 [cf. Caloplaca sp. 3 TL-2023]
MFMELPVSGIHRLFAAASSQSSQAYRSTHLESVTEESHTYDLLYPDFNALQQSQDQVFSLRQTSPASLASAASSFDDRGGLDIQNPRDVRIIIAQDGNLSQQAKVLFDTHPPPSLPTGRLGTPIESSGDNNGEGRQKFGMTNKSNTSPASSGRSKHTRYFSLGRAVQTPPLEQSSPLAPPLEQPRGAFGTPRFRRTGMRPVTSDGDTNQSRLARDGKDEVEALLGCMFGTTGLPLVSGTKLHVRPSGTTVDSEMTRSATDPTSPDAGSVQPNMRRRTPLTRSTTADSIHTMSASAPAERPETHISRSPNASVLITRLFTIDPAEPLSPRLNQIQQQGSPLHPEMQAKDLKDSNRSSDVSDTAGAKQFKCPAYALSLMLRLPSVSQQGWPSLASPVSPDSPRPSNFSSEGQWTEAKASDPVLLGADRDVEQVISNWSLLTRLMTVFEVIIRKKILSLLADVDLASLHPPVAPSPTPITRNTNEQLKSPVKKVKQPSQRTIQLPADALQDSEDIRSDARRVGERVAVGLRTQRVATGQGRWGAWREEARWVGRWAGNREQNFFFFNLLTAFLGSHTDWLDSLEGLRSRRSRKGVDKKRHVSPVGRQQTVVVSTNKMAARRLIFLLSAFLPGSAPQMMESSLMPRFMKTGTSFSQSPPSGIPILRETSLRRTINRRHRGNRSSQSSAGLNNKPSGFAGAEVGSNGDDDQAKESKSGLHSRRTSNARSMVTPALPIATGGDRTRKSSTTTTSTIIPETAVPVAHFSNASRDLSMGTTAVPRPGSSGSLASLSLQHTLHRSESNEHSNASTASHSFGRWGSMISGFWSNRRESSTDESETFSRSAEGLGISGVTKMPGQTSSMGTLERMVEDAEAIPRTDRQTHNVHQLPPVFSTSDAMRDTTPDAATDGVEGPVTQARAIPERPRSESFPVKLSVDDTDGIIDVQIPQSNSFSSSFGSLNGSVGQCQTTASSLNERSSVFTRSPSKERSQRLSESPTDVAGWLKEYSPDFILQAVKPYQGLKKDVEVGMKTEPSVTSPTERTGADKGTSDDWTEVRTSLIADTTKFSITRLRLERRSHIPKAPSAGSAFSAHPETTRRHTEERIIEEPIMDMDPILIDAVERVLAQSGHSSRVQSRGPSRAPSPTRFPKAKSHSDLRGLSSTGKENNIPNPPALEVPKSECKKLVLGALEEVVRSVQAEQDAGESGGARRISGEPVRTGGGDGFPPDSTLREGVRRWLRDVGPIPVAS